MTTQTFRQRLRDAIGGQEVLLVAGLTLITVGLWGDVGRLALVAPGVVLLWLSIPARVGFLTRPSAQQHARR